ncbi:MAG: hypothetical protein WKF47_15985 [Geodermatophilaceae bacterium]
MRLTRWLVARGVRAAHVIVRFTEDPPNTVFSGAMPVEALPGETGLHHASVTCCVGPDRGEEFHAALGEEIALALGMTEQTPFLYIEFRPVLPSDVYLAATGRLARADAIASGQENR